jgi:thiamine-phosphate pyrophosphorylase
MAESLLLYYITDRHAFPGDESARRRRLLEKIAEAARAGVDYIQLREKDLSTRDLESLARDAVNTLNQLRSENRELRTALLINSRADVAIAAGADGVHLRSEDISAEEVRAIWRTADVGTAALEACPERPEQREGSRTGPAERSAAEAAAHVGTAALGCPAQRSSADAAASNEQRPPVIGVSCHSSAGVAHAAATGASFAVFGPVFEKGTADPKGLDELGKACRNTIPVLALGGITLANAHLCLAAGAAGIAAIRLFQDNDIGTVAKGAR